jgi:hypothetical protein
MDELSRINEILDKNKDKSFVKRILEPNNYPSVDVGYGKPSTHLMAYGEGDGKYFVYPTLLYGEGKLTHLEDEPAYQHARKTGNYIEFDNEEDAAWFSKSYKKVWD